MLQSKIPSLLIYARPGCLLRQFRQADCLHTSALTAGRGLAPLRPADLPLRRDYSVGLLASRLATDRCLTAPLSRRRTAWLSTDQHGSDSSSSSSPPVPPRQSTDDNSHSDETAQPAAGSGEADAPEQEQPAKKKSKVGRKKGATKKKPDSDDSDDKKRVVADDNDSDDVSDNDNDDDGNNNNNNDDDDGGDDKDKTKKKKKKKAKGVLGWLKQAYAALPMEVKGLLAVAVGLTVLPSLLRPSAGDKEITWKMFALELLERDDLDHLEVVGSEFVRVYLSNNPGHAAYYFYIGDRASFDSKLAAAQDDLGRRVADRVPVVYSQPLSSGHGFNSLSLLLISSAALMLLLSQAAKGMGASMMGRMMGGNARVVKPEQVKVKFADVAGCDEAKLEIMEFVEFLRQPDKFRKLGARIPKGALLCGPPGTGKTLLAKATAGEAGVPFFSISGSEFVEVYVGVGPSRVRKLFATARAKAPCIVFIDEIDAIGQKRDNKHNPNMERENTLNQLLVEMDGFRQGSEVIVLAATNRDDTLDPALLRPGRFDRRVTVGLPEIKGRKDILLIHMKNLLLKGDREEWAKRIAALTPGMSGAELANVCNEAALIAARTNEPVIDLPHLEAAIERVIAGMEKKSRLLSAAEKRTVAYHEAGHAIVGWYLEHADPLLKVSIVPRGQALGYAQLQAKERNVLNQEQILDRVCVSLGGRAAEQLVFGEITSGASDDLSRVTHMAYGCVTRYGFGSEVGHVSFPDDSPYAVEKPYSDHTSRMIDLQVREYVKQAFQRTLAILEQRRDQLELVAQLLLQREVISREDMERLLGKRPWNQSTSYEELSGEA